MKLTKFKQELGKAFTVSSVGVLVMVFITTKITGDKMSEHDFFFCVAGGFMLLALGVLFLAEKDTKPLPGKWKRVKVKKDTTIHIQEEE